MSIHKIRIRFAFERRLKGATRVDDRVFRSRTTPLVEGELPCILIFTGDEAIAEATSSPRTFERVVRTWVEVAAEVSPSMESVLDRICEEVEDAVNVDETFGQLVSDCVLVVCETPPPPERSRVDFGARRMGFDVTYHSAPIEGATLLDLTHADVDWDLAEPDGVIEAEDEITL